MKSPWLKASLSAMFVVSLLIALVIIGCSDDDDNEQVEFMLLDNGNSWTFKIYSTAGTGLFTMMVTRTQQVNGITVSRIDFDGYFFPSSYWILLANRENGLTFFGDETNGELDTPVLWCPANPSIGQSWTTSVQGRTIVWEVLATNEVVTVPAGTFSCILVRESVGGADIHHFWTPGTGEVKMVNNYASLSYELISFSIAS